MADAGDGLPYQLHGEFFELCDCYTVCPCWVGLPPSEGRCTGAFAWSIDEGEIDGVAVDGEKVCSVSFHTGHRDTGGQEVFLFVDEGADDEQYEKLATVFTGRGGGPLAELATLMGVLRDTERAAIDVASKGRFLTMTVGQKVSGDGEALLGSDGGITELSHGRLSTVLGPTAEVGRSSAFRVDLGGLGFSVDVTGRSAMRGRFRYRNGT